MTVSLELRRRRAEWADTPARLAVASRDGDLQGVVHSGEDCGVYAIAAAKLEELDAGC
ncbi:hypothetical protein AB0H71_13565 [Nocardia sp. NPDC050697]|uniref:hypothetical protein n=1 Tax=Nocardia sp. NPDC050697 TaxID=3155158 RepID=UPI0033F3EF94